ncbi:MAG TPA: hypothetical protein VNQ77_01075 [Frankiaceae bacterium]|nr:hypothetical protein [Frankiaceae bacterium]
MPRLPLAAALAALAFLGVPAAAEPTCFDSRILLDHDLYYSGCTEVSEHPEGGYCVQSVGTVAGRPYHFVCVQ